MIDTKLLRQKILDLAIRGKLVPQDPKDEPASELLKKIKAEKEALIKAGKMKRDKHESFIFRGDDKRYYEQIDGKTNDISGEIPFDLPNGWAWCRLRSLGAIIGGGTPPTLNAEYWNGKVSWLSPADLTDYHAKYISRGKKNITADGLAHSSAVLMPAGSVLYSSRAPIGYVVIAQNAISTNQGFKSLVPAINGLSEFIYYVLVAVTPDIKRRATGTTFKEISGAEFGETLISLPPLAEQERIVVQIESLLRCVDEIDRESATLEKSLTLAKQKILDLAIRGKLVPQDPNDEPASELLKKIKAEKEALIKAGKMKRDKHESFIFRGDDNCYHENVDGETTDITKEISFEIPDSWEWVRFSFLIQVISGTSYEKKDICSQGIRILRGGNIQDFGLHFFKDDVFLPIGYYDEEKRVRLNDVVFVASTGSKAAIGKPAFVDHPIENAQIGAFLRIARPCISQQSVWINTIFASEYYREHVRDCVKGTNINNIKQEHITELLVPFPPLAEQKRIVSQIEKLFSLLETMRV